MKTKIKEILKYILLYGTIIYFGFILLTTEGIGETMPWLLLPLYFVLIVLLLTCGTVFRNGAYEKYVPKWFRDDD